MKGATIMAYRDQNGAYITAGEWIQMGLDKGISPESLLHALEAQMAEKQAKPQEGTSLASGNLAVTRRDWFQNWYRELGFNLSILVPPISDAEYKRRQELGQALFYRPATYEVFYDQFMTAVGQSNHWTVVDNGRNKIVWERTQEGYWFWAEIAQECPHLGTSWNTLVKEQKRNLLSLEEYVIVWWANKANTNIMLDTRTWSWLRTRFGQSALHANESLSGVCVDRWSTFDLAYSYVFGGGRLAEVVQNAS